jgi:hypothetical protein
VSVSAFTALPQIQEHWDNHRGFSGLALPSTSACRHLPLLCLAESQTISSSSTAESERRALAKDSHKIGNDPKSFPLREMSLHRPLSMYAIARNPSHFSSKIQSGWLKGARIVASGMGWTSGIEEV